MASFGIHVDKENASQVQMMSHIRTSHIARGPVGKTFQSSQSIGVTPLRKALGDVNTRHVGGRQTLKGGHQMTAPVKPVLLLKPPAPTSKSAKPKLQEKQKVSQKSAEVKVEVKPVAVKQLPEMEHMPLTVEPEDDFEDIWPSSERPATYVDQLKAWRPSRLFPLYGSREATEDSEDELLTHSDNESDCPSPVRDLSLEEPDIEFEDAGFADIPFPSLADLPLPPLDDRLSMDDVGLYAGLH